MPELPEIAVFARDMQKELVGRTICGVEVLQPKCLNMAEDNFRTAVTDAKIRSVSSHGKWLKVETTKGWLLLNLGMGGEILLTDREHLPEKYRLILDFAEGACLAVNFWKWIWETLPSRGEYRRSSGLYPLSMACTLLASNTPTILVRGSGSPLTSLLASSSVAASCWQPRIRRQCNKERPSKVYA